MKIRNGFVSNSSSSSFICEVCGRIEAGMDLEIENADMFECEKGHIICIDKALFPIFNSYSKKKKINYLLHEFHNDSELYPLNIKELQKAVNNEDQNKINLALKKCRISSYPTSYCPICQFTEINTQDVLNFFLRCHNTTLDEINKDIRNRFSSYEDFQKFIKG